MQEFALGDFLSRWAASARHDLSASESETLLLPDLLAMASAEDLRRWETLTLGYGDPRGAPWLRQAIAATYVDIPVDATLCFAGAQDAIGCVTRALLDPGDHAVVVLPCYPPSEWAITTVAPTTGIALDPARGWVLDLDLLASAITPVTRMVVTNFPNNPTGALISHDALDALIALCRRHGLWLVNDEVYRLIDRDPDKRLPQVAEIYERGVSVNAMSKSFGLPGLRVGWVACADRAAMARIEAVRHVQSGGLAVPSEILAHIALLAATRILSRNRAIAEANLNLLRAFMARHDSLFAWDEPAGGVAAFPHYCGSDRAESFAASLVQQAGVLVLPGRIWHSPLAHVPDARLRVGFGRNAMEPALVAWEAFLLRRESTAQRRQKVGRQAAPARP